MIVSYHEVKHPFAHLRKGDYSSVVFVEISDNNIISWDDIPVNYPRWTLATHTKKEAIGRIRGMVDNEGWRLVSSTEDDLRQEDD